MHKFFLVAFIILVVLTFMSSDKAHAFAPSVRFIMVLITVAWLLIWAGAAIVKAILPVSFGAGVISFLGGVMFLGCLIFAYSKLDKRKHEKRSAVIEDFRKEQISLYKQRDLIKKFIVAPNIDTEDSINSISIEITFKNDSLIKNYSIELLAFVYVSNEHHRLLYEYTLISSSMSLCAESEREISYKLEMSADELRYNLKELKERFGNEVKLDYSVYIKGKNYVLGGHLRPGVCLTSVPDEIIQEKDYLINGYPYAATYPALSDSKLMLNTVLNLEQFRITDKVFNRKAIY